MRFIHFLILFIAADFLLLFSCKSPEQERFEAYIKEGEILAATYCTTCHRESPPELLNKKTWVFDVLPQMGPRLGIRKYKTLHYNRIHSMLGAKFPVMEQEQWDNIVDYFYASSPDSLPKQDFNKQPIIDCKTFLAYPFTNDLSSSSIITLSEIDTAKKYIFVCDAGNSTLFKFDYAGNLLDTMQLASPSTSMHIEHDFFDMTLVGILHPNNENLGQIVRYEYNEKFESEKNEVIIDSLYRPVSSIYFDFNYDGFKDYLVCEYGNDIGRLSLYFAKEDSQFERYIIEDIPGSMMVKIHDFNKDGFMDIVALFAQGDEKIMIYYNDGEGNFRNNFSMAARFPSVYGSMYFDIHDFNQDGFMDIVYVNGDNFDYSQILKPYHGIRILENDGNNLFNEKYFYPIYGAGKAKVADFDLDGDSDIIVSSNFADMENNPERGIIYLENIEEYHFNAYAFEASAQNQWNTIEVEDFDEDGDLDVIIGAMNLSNVLKVQKGQSKEDIVINRTSLLLLENKTY